MTLNRRMLKLLGAVIVLDLLLFVGAFAYLQSRSREAPVSSAVESGAGFVRYPAAVRLRDFQLVDQGGEEFSADNLRGRWTLVFFGFTSCEDVCPLTLLELKQFHAALPGNNLPADTRVILVSVDPARDTPAVLKDYLASFNPDFVGLTGDLAAVADLASQLYIARMDPPVTGQEHADHGAHPTNYQVEHSANIAVLNPDGDYIGAIISPHTDHSLLAAFSALGNF